MATPSYRERMKAARAEARAKREAGKAAWHRRIELSVEARRIAMAATKAAIRARGDKVWLYSHAQLTAMANAMIGPGWWPMREQGLPPNEIHTHNQGAHSWLIGYLRTRDRNGGGLCNDQRIRSG